MPTEKNRAHVDCAYFKPFTFSYYSVHEIELIPTESGWYCWVFVPFNDDDVSVGLTWHSELAGSVTGSLGLKYAGALSPITPEKEELTQRDFDRMREAMLAFAPPLYIGMAKNLKVRLMAHLRAIDSAPKPLSDHIPLPDTDEESALFGRRIGDFMRRKNLSPKGLFVKCIISQGAKLKSVETMLNRMFTPPYGRRA